MILFHLGRYMMKKINKQRKDYLSWEEYFMGIAKLSAMRSKDPSTQEFPWDREGDPLNTKYLYVCHAEMNAILNYRGSRKELENAKIYVDLFPCNECAKLIIQAGIKEVIYLSDKYKDTDGVIASKKLFDTCGVKYRQIKLTGKDVKLNL